jgi:hypothetical protein
MHNTQHPANTAAPPASNPLAGLELTRLLEPLAENRPWLMRRQAI